MKTFRLGGIHPSPSKLTADIPILELGTPEEPIVITLRQHIGKPAIPIVKPGQKVSAGEMIAKADGFMSASVHSPVFGKVKSIEPVRDAYGLWKDAVIIIPDDTSDNFDAGLRRHESTTPWGQEDENPQGNAFEQYINLPAETLIKTISDSGIVGLGGATFPTHVKLTVPDGREADRVIINGAECEPYLTCDDALMRAEAPKIISGVRLVMKCTGATEGIIGVEANKPEAIEALRIAAHRSRVNIHVETLRTRYPQGSEKQLIESLTRRRVPAGGLPIDVGVVVQNVATTFAIYEAVVRGITLTHRVVTVSGPLVSSPGNFLVPLGTPLRQIIDFAGGLPENTGKVIAGGPMMGRAVCNLDAPSEKGLGGIVILPKEMSLRATPQSCIRCGRCLEACPMRLEPYLLATLAAAKRKDDLNAHGIRNCLECGCCSYVCPSSRPLVDLMRLGKQIIR